jgi:hypothetical protein
LEIFGVQTFGGPFGLNRLVDLLWEVAMIELPFSSAPVVHVIGGEPQCALCQMIACPKLARDADAGLVLSKQCAIHSAIVFVIVDYLWRAFQD